MQSPMSQTHMRLLMSKQLLLWVAFAIVGATVSAYLVTEMYPSGHTIAGESVFSELRSVAAGDAGIDIKYCSMRDTKVTGSSQLRKKGGCIFHELEPGKGRRWYISSESTVMAESGYPANGFEAGTWHEWTGIPKPTGSFEEYIACRQCGALVFQTAFDTPFATVTKPLICGGSDDYRGATDQCGQGGGCSQGFYCASYGPASWHKYCTGKTYLGCGNSEAVDPTSERGGKQNQGLAKVTIANGVIFVAGYSSGIEPVAVAEPTAMPVPTSIVREPTLSVPLTVPTSSVSGGGDLLPTPTDQTRLTSSQSGVPSVTPTASRVVAGTGPSAGGQSTPTQPADSQSQPPVQSPILSAYQMPQTLPITGLAGSPIPLYGLGLLFGSVAVLLLL